MNVLPTRFVVLHFLISIRIAEMHKEGMFCFHH